MSFASVAARARGALRRIAVVALTLLAVAALTYSLIDLLPGDPTVALLGEGATPESQAELRAELGLDRAWPVRFAGWIGDVATGDLGRSYVTGQPIADALGQRLPVTVELVVASQVLAIGVALVVGALISMPRAGRLRSAALAVAQVTVSIPPFVWAVVLIATLSVGVGLFPVTGWTPWGENPLGHLRSLALPVAALALGPAALYLRLLCSAIDEVRDEDFVDAARARGVPDRRVVTHHLLRPSVGSLTAVVALSAGSTIGGAVLVEEIFAIPGVGRLLVDSIGTRDYLVVQAVVLVIAVGYVLLAVAADVTQNALDPRTRERA